MAGVKGKSGGKRQGAGRKSRSFHMRVGDTITVISRMRVDGRPSTATRYTVSDIGFHLHLTTDDPEAEYQELALVPADE